eukprot:6181583-Pleurochrysis_carterae.AAC.1
MISHKEEKQKSEEKVEEKEADMIKRSRDDKTEQMREREADVRSKPTRRKEDAEQGEARARRSISSDCRGWLPTDTIKGP